MNSIASPRGAAVVAMFYFLAACGGCGAGGGATAPSSPAPAASSASGDPTGDSWWGLVLGQVRSASGSALVTIHDGTGWLLGKNKVDIEQVGEFEEIDGVKYASYRISVSRSDESFSAEIEEIECDEFGIPTDQSQEKMDEAVGKIKQMLDRLQS